MTQMTPISALPGFKFGCDPELFVVNGEDKPVSAAGLIPGDKHKPYPVKCGAVQVDGMAAEFNIDPVSTFEEWDNNIETVLKELKTFLPKGHKLVALPSVVFDKDVFDSAPDEAKILGCNPDFNAWSGKANPPPSTVADPYLRTAAGHIHIGWTDNAQVGDIEHMAHCRDLVKQLDWYLGAWSLKHDPDTVRRRLYGKAGACRYKPYGVEYRVLSNFWVTNRSKRLEVWNQLQAAINDMADDFLPQRNPGFEGHLRAAIDEGKMFGKVLSNHFRYPLSTLNRSHKGW